MYLLMLWSSSILKSYMPTLEHFRTLGTTDWDRIRPVTFFAMLTTSEHWIAQRAAIYVKVC